MSPKQASELAQITEKPASNGQIIEFDTKLAKLPENHPINTGKRTVKAAIIAVYHRGYHSNDADYFEQQECHQQPCESSPKHLILSIRKVIGAIDLNNQEIRDLEESERSTITELLGIQHVFTCIDHINEVV